MVLGVTGGRDEEAKWGLGRETIQYDAIVVDACHEVCGICQNPHSGVNCYENVPASTQVCLV